MCGFLFLHAPSQIIEVARCALENSLQTMLHRGPDEQGILTKDDTHFAHARLSIVGLTDSHQPMQSPDARHTLLFNGEIYNYRQLRQSLESKWAFRTQGDTEVLLAGLSLEGEAFLTRLEGMWAFALWDAHERRLLLSRDRMGKKPLYYHQYGTSFACGSELPALRRLSPQSWTEDLNSTADYFRYGYCLPGYTAWENVFEVLPGHALHWQPNCPIEQRAYWQLPLPASPTSSTSDDELRTALTEAVAKRLIADVEVGAFLSGGIDSSLVCALAQKQMKRPLKTFTIGFSDAAFDESPYAAQVATHLGTDHYCETFQNWSEGALETLLRDHVGQPFADASLLPTSLVSQVAAQQVKVALSGDGADELFGGYQRYQARLILRWYSRLPSGLRKMAERALRSLPEPTAHHSRSLLKKAHLFVDVAQRQRAETPYTAPLMFHPEEYARLFPQLLGRGHRPHGLPEHTRLDDLQQMLYGDALIYLPQDILTKVDRASMAASLETRAPFLDHKVVELAFSRPATHHLRIGQGKRWLRQSFGDLLPAQTWQRRKQGFGVPIHQWFQGPMGERFDTLIRRQANPISTPAATQLLAEHRSGRRDNGYRLWMLYIYMVLNNR
ncbi:MAG: asparagine synthase (glutamine-hydrolyzing) [Rhodocyclaceae bacterium]